MTPHETLRGRLMLACREHSIGLEELLRTVGGDALPMLADAAQGVLATRIEREQETHADLMHGAERYR